MMRAVAALCEQLPGADEVRVTGCRVPEDADDDGTEPNAVLFAADHDGAGAQRVVPPYLTPTPTLYASIGFMLALELSYARGDRMCRAKVRR